MLIIFPNRLQRFPKSVLLPLWKSVGGVEDDCPRGPKQSAGHSFAAVAFHENIGKAGPHDPVYLAFEDVRRHAPPAGMDCYSICHRQLLAVNPDRVAKWRIFGNLFKAKDGIEGLLAKVICLWKKKR
jgi:hypothetical protein